MKIFIYFIFLLIMGFSCSPPEQKKAATANNNLNGGDISKNVIELTKTYLSGQLKNPVIGTEGTGVIKISGEGMIFLIIGNDINIGQIDEDNRQDAIVSYTVIPTGKAKYRKHLLMLNKGEIKVVRDFASEMQVMQISNRIIYTEIPKHGPDNPLHSCNECKDHVSYKWAGDSLQVIK
jgi:hypothetical protein